MLPNLQTFLLCGEVLSGSTAQKLLDRFPNARIYNLYGPTEATVAVSAVLITQDLLNQALDLPVGRFKPDCEIRIVGEDGEMLTGGEKGEIHIIGSSVSSGYYRNEQKTVASFYQIDGKRAYRTGDIGYFENEMLFFIGRKDFQVKLQGYRIELEDIETNLNKLEIVRHAAVVPKLKNNKCEYIAAFVAVEFYPPEDPFTLAMSIKQQLAARVPAYMIPKKIMIKESLPMTANGKIDRKALAGEV